jgi:hypothetical protein
MGEPFEIAKTKSDLNNSLSNEELEKNYFETEIEIYYNSTAKTSLLKTHVNNQLKQSYLKLLVLDEAFQVKSSYLMEAK